MPADCEMFFTVTSVVSVLPGKTSAWIVPLPSRFRNMRSSGTVSVLPR